jgi:hypothetical protein
LPVDKCCPVDNQAHTRIRHRAPTIAGAWLSSQVRDQPEFILHTT